MKIEIFGAGALGSLIGAFLVKAGFDVVFVARGKQLEALKRKLIISGIIEEEFDVYATDKPEDVDLVFLTVKAYDTEAAAKILKETDFKAICSLQNGVGNEEILMKYFENVVGGVVTYGANLIEYGHVMFAGEGEIHLGDFRGNYAGKFCEVLRRADLNVHVVDDIQKRIWVKAAVNAVINPITAICRVKNGKILEKDLWDIAEKIAKECEKVLKAKGFHVDVIKLVREVASKTAENRSSMLQDIEKGKRTEIDFINGAFVKEAEKMGIKATYNEIMTKLVRGMELGMA